MSETPGQALRRVLIDHKAGVLLDCVDDPVRFNRMANAFLAEMAGDCHFCGKAADARPVCDDCWATITDGDPA